MLCAGNPRKFKLRLYRNTESLIECSELQVNVSQIQFCFALKSSYIATQPDKMFHSCSSSNWSSAPRLEERVTLLNYQDSGCAIANVG